MPRRSRFASIGGAGLTALGFVGVFVCCAAACGNDDGSTGLMNMANSSASQSATGSFGASASGAQPGAGSQNPTGLSGMGGGATLGGASNSQNSTPTPGEALSSNGNATGAPTAAQSSATGAPGGVQPGMSGGAGADTPLSMGQAGMAAGGANPGMGGGATAQAGAAPDLPTPTGGGDGFYRMESLDRGVVAVETNGGVYVGWRMFGYEYDPNDESQVAYNVYRNGELVATVSDSTNLMDADGNADASYSVSAVVGGTEQAQSASVGVWNDSYISIPLSSPGNGYSANDASAADLDGDGQYELILKWDPNNAKDNSQSGVTDDVYLDALELDGTQLWRINLGPNIRAGAHYTQFIVMDFDGDGRAEMAVKTAPGTLDGTGNYLSMGPAASDDDTAVYRNNEGYILSGPEYLSVFDGETGAELATTEFDQARGNVGSWGDDYGNRVDRFLATAAYLDDTGLPSFVMARGYYTRTTLTAWNWRDGTLDQIWKFDSNETPKDSSNNDFTGQGSHSLSVANVDEDPQQEIIYGAMTVDHDGTGKCSTGLNHGDALHVTDLLPDRPGLEVFMPHEYDARPLWSLRDAATCEMILAGALSDNDVGRGVAGDITPSNPGGEFWASSGVSLTSAETGQAVGGGTPSSINFLIWWDADESRELEDGTSITKFGGGNLLSCMSCASNNGTKSTPTLSADLLGDWREEIVWREADNSALRLYTTTDVTERRIYTLMHDAQYRVAISWQNVAYNQPPHPSFHIGSGMAAPPKPDINVQ